MAVAKKVKEIQVSCRDELGMLSKVADTLKKAKLNIHSLQAFAIMDQAYFRIVVSNTNLAVKRLKERGFEAFSKDVVLVEFPNTVGTLAPLAKKLGESGIDIKYCYVTSADGEKVIGIFSTHDDKKALKIIG